MFEAPGQGTVDVDAGRGEQATDGLLREVLHAAAAVAGPLVERGRRVVVDGDEGQLVQPAGDVTVAVHEAGRGAGAEGDAQDGVSADRHRAGQRCHLTIVDDGERNAREGA